MRKYGRGASALAAVEGNIVRVVWSSRGFNGVGFYVSTIRKRMTMLYLENIWIMGTVTQD